MTIGIGQHLFENVFKFFYYSVQKGTFYKRVCGLFGVLLE